MELRETASRRGDSPGGGRRVLIVEDSPLQRRLLEDHLRAVGFAVRVEPTAAAALAALAEGTPDAILCDIVLPRMDGFSLCRTIRADADVGRLPVVLVTSTDVDESDRLLARRSGASALVARRPGYDAVVEALIGALAEGGENEATEIETVADLRGKFVTEGAREASGWIDSVGPGTDWELLGRTAHRWIGRGGALGFPAIADGARALDEATSARDADRAAAALESLVRLFQGAVAARAESPTTFSLARIEPEPDAPAPVGRVCRPAARDVVIADDDETVLAIVQATLRNSGWRCHLVADGIEALAVTKRLRPDAVVIDVNMPGRDGFDVLSALRNDARTRGIPVVLLTARHQEIDVIRGFDLGAADYVAKPFNPLELAARLERLAPEEEE